MKAYVIEQAGGPEVLQLRDIGAPEGNNDEVLVRVRAFGLNRAEIYRRQGKMGPIDSPVVPGIEAVGEVIRDPSGTFRTGQRVATAMGGLQFSRPGSYAEQVSAPAQNLISLDGIDLTWDELAALPESYLTAWGALDHSLQIQRGQTLLVRGATSAVGMASVAYAKARGLNVIATTRTVSNEARLNEAGADEVIIDTGEIADLVRRSAPGGVDAVLEVVGAATLRDSVKALRPFGGASVIGLLGGAPVLESFHLMQDLPGAVHLNFFPSGLLGTAALPLSESPLRWIAQEIAAGRIPSLRTRTFDFDDVRQAHRLMESNAAVGKFVVQL